MIHTTILNRFFQRISSDDSINTSHVSIYMLLYQFWTRNQFKNPVQITRADIMAKTKINSKATYHKCMKELHDLGFISYNPSYHPINGSNVSILTPQFSNEKNES